ncbi:M48 family metalloprotease [Pyxidicoccus sp. 3LG]
MTVLAALGVGVLASPCGGINASMIKGEDIGSTLVGAADKTMEVVGDYRECQKLDVDPAVAEEYALGGSLAIHFVQRGGGLLLEKPPANGKPRATRRPGEALHDYVNTVGKNLAAQSQRPTLEWTFGVFNDKSQLNALSAPGGYVLVSQQVLAKVDNEGQLAGVLSHEIAHVVLKHAIRQYNGAKVSTCEKVLFGKTVADITGISAALRAALGGNGTLDLDNNPELLEMLVEKTLGSLDEGNAKELELEADQMAVQLMMSAGYDPQDYIGLLGKLQDGTDHKNHPPKKDRQANVQRYLSKLKTKEGEFPGLATEGFRSPPLKESALAAVRKGTGVAKDSK